MTDHELPALDSVLTEVGVGLASDGKGKVYYNIVLAKPK